MQAKDLPCNTGTVHCKKCEKWLQTKECPPIRPKACPLCHHFFMTPAHQPNGSHICPKHADGTRVCRGLNQCATGHLYVITPLVFPLLTIVVEQLMVKLRRNQLNK